MGSGRGHARGAGALLPARACGAHRRERCCTTTTARGGGPAGEAADRDDAPNGAPERRRRRDHPAAREGRKIETWPCERKCQVRECARTAEASPSRMPPVSTSVAASATGPGNSGNVCAGHDHGRSMRGGAEHAALGCERRPQRHSHRNGRKQPPARTVRSRRRMKRSSLSSILMTACVEHSRPAPTDAIHGRFDRRPGAPARRVVITSGMPRRQSTKTELVFSFLPVQLPANVGSRQHGRHDYATNIRSCSRSPCMSSARQ